MQRIKTAFLITLVMFLWGCLETKQVVFDPMLNISSTDLGSGKIISLKVLDERPTTRIAEIFNSRKFELFKFDRDIDEIVYDKLSNGLIKKGFGVEKNNKRNPNKLTVEIRAMKVLTGRKGQSAFKARCKTSSTKYNNFYSLDTHADDIQSDGDRFLKGDGMAYKDNVDAYNNLFKKIMNQGLTKIFNDEKLFSCLSKG